MCVCVCVCAVKDNAMIQYKIFTISNLGIGQRVLIKGGGLISKIIRFSMYRNFQTSCLTAKCRP